MARFKFTFVCALLAMASMCAAQTRPAGPYGAREGMGYGPREFVIRWASEGPFPNQEELSRQLRTTIPEEVAKQLGIPKATLLDGLKLNMGYSLLGASGAITVQASIELPEGKVKPAEVLDAIGKRLREAVAQQAEKQMQAKIVAAERSVAEARRHWDDLNNRIENLRARAREKSGRSEVSQESFRAAMGKLDDEAQSLRLDKADQAARLEALQEVIAVQSKRLEEAVRSDPVSWELEKVVEHRTRALKVVEEQYKNGLSTPQDVSKAQAELAEARVRLAERREALAGTSSVQLGTWNRELQNLSIETRQKAARLAAIEKAIKQLQDALPLLSDVSRLQEELQLIRSELVQAQSDLNAARKQARERQMPTVIEQ